MISKEAYMAIIAGLLNRDSDSKERERKVREANRELYRYVVEPNATNTEADLALAGAARKVND